MKVLMIGALLLGATPLVAQPAPPPPVADLEPSRLAAARALIDQIFPPETREQMITAMIAPMTANIRQSLTQNQSFIKALDSDPRAKAVFEKYMDRQIARSNEVLLSALPAMSDAMTRAYARRFDIQQLRDLASFFRTPTGRAYIDASMTIMSDPDIAAWQRGLMDGSMNRIQDDIAAMMKELAALQSAGKSQ